MVQPVNKQRFLFLAPRLTSIRPQQGTALASKTPVPPWKPKSRRLPLPSPPAKVAPSGLKCLLEGGRPSERRSVPGPRGPARSAKPPCQSP